LLDLHSGNAYRNANALVLIILSVLGALIALAAELPYGGWMQIPLLSILWWRLSLLKDCSLKQYFFSSLTFGIGYFVAGLWWLYISLHDVGGMNVLLSCMAVFCYRHMLLSISLLPVYQYDSLHPLIDQVYF
jgi:apolipoprotein N-acyltransferase